MSPVFGFISIMLLGISLQRDDVSQYWYLGASAIVALLAIAAK